MTLIFYGIVRPFIDKIWKDTIGFEESWVGFVSFEVLIQTTPLQYYLPFLRWIALTFAADILQSQDNDSHWSHDFDDALTSTALVYDQVSAHLMTFPSSSAVRRHVLQ